MLRLFFTVAVSALVFVDGLAQVPASRLLSEGGDSGEWLTYSGSYRSHRFSPLTEITTANVARLRTAWTYQCRDAGAVQATPIVANGLIYLTCPPATTVALSPRTGRPLWRWTRPLPQKIATIGFGRTNRGVAVLGDVVYVGTLDGSLAALDAQSGVERWVVRVADNKDGYSITSAPLVADGKVIIGVSGGEAGVRGFLDAYDAATGKRVWRFWTVPGHGEPGNQSWSGESWQRGGGTTWLTGSYDPGLKLLYWGTGNPAPWSGDTRAGDNLYTCSLLALDIETGKLRWHFQFTPHDTHDWDANQIPVLVDAQVGGRSRQLVATANRNGFYYLLDRATGEFLLGTPYAKQTWASGLDQRGRPIVIPGSEPNEDGVLVYPSLQGATNWGSPAYSPATGMFYVPAREMGSQYFKTKRVEYVPGGFYTGMTEQVLREEASGAIRALDLVTGRRMWEFPLPSPPWGGLLATAGGLVFSGSNEGNFFALDASTGKPLWDFQTGGSVSASPIAFRVDGVQHIAIASGNALYVFALALATTAHAFQSRLLAGPPIASLSTDPIAVTMAPQRAPVATPNAISAMRSMNRRRPRYPYRVDANPRQLP
jgi:alcohol dehydrogenase (cytochrome c)